MTVNIMQLQKLGIEIRKIGNLKNLYDDVDLVLSRYKIPESSVNSQVQSATIAHSLQRMLKTERYFDVCTVRNCANVAQISIPAERMAIYQSIHCMSWSEMLPDYRQAIVAMVLDDFRSILNPNLNVNGQ